MADHEAVILLHGFMQKPAVMWPLAFFLRRRGYYCYTPGYRSWHRPLAANLAALEHQIDALRPDRFARVHFIGHSLGGLMARALLARRRPDNLGNVVHLGTPNGGSEIADLLTGHRLGRRVLGATGDLLCVARTASVRDCLGRIDYPLGVIAGSKPLFNGPFSRHLPLPHDGKVSVAATHADGQSDHMILPVTHAGLPFDRRVREQCLYFLRHGRFSRDQ